MQDQPAELVEVVLVRDRLAHVAVLLRRARRVELLELDAVVDDRLQQVERPDRVRHHGLVRAVPRLADVRLRAEVEDVRLVGRLARGRASGSRSTSCRSGRRRRRAAAAQVADVVQRAATRSRARTRSRSRRAATSASVRCEPMKPSAPVTRHVRSRVDVPELGLRAPRARSPSRWRYRRRAPMEGNRSGGQGGCSERASDRGLDCGGQRLGRGARGHSRAQVWARR